MRLMPARQTTIPGPRAFFRSPVWRGFFPKTAQGKTPKKKNGAPKFPPEKGFLPKKRQKDGGGRRGERKTGPPAKNPENSRAPT